jgi:hypothetical protein
MSARSSWSNPRRTCTSIPAQTPAYQAEATNILIYAHTQHNSRKTPCDTIFAQTNQGNRPRAPCDQLNSWSPVCMTVCFSADSLWTIHRSACSGTMRYWEYHFPTRSRWEFTRVCGTGARGRRKEASTRSTGTLRLSLRRSVDSA